MILALTLYCVSTFSLCMYAINDERLVLRDRWWAFFHLVVTVFGALWQATH
jgi:hypothetical protein